MLGDAQTWIVGAVTAILGALGGITAYRKNFSDVQTRNIAALELRVKILEKDNENHIREKAALAIEAQLHEEDYRTLIRDNRHMERQIESNNRRISQLEHFVKMTGQEPPEPNGGEEEELLGRRHGV